MSPELRDFHPQSAADMKPIIAEVGVKGGNLVVFASQYKFALACRCQIDLRQHRTAASPYRPCKRGRREMNGTCSSVYRNASRPKHAPYASQRRCKHVSTGFFHRWCDVLAVVWLGCLW